MEQEFTPKIVKKIPFTSKIASAIAGVFLTSLIFGTTVRFFDTAGIWIGLIVSAFLVFAGFYWIKKGTLIRITAWAILVTLVIGTAAFFIGLKMLSSNLDILLN